MKTMWEPHQLASNADALLEAMRVPLGQLQSHTGLVYDVKRVMASMKINVRSVKKGIQNLEIFV